MIVEVSLYNGPQPFPELLYWQMSASSKFLLQRSGAQVQEESGAARVFQVVKRRLLGPRALA